MLKKMNHKIIIKKAPCPEFIDLQDIEGDDIQKVLVVRSYGVGNEIISVQVLSGAETDPSYPSTKVPNLVGGEDWKRHVILNPSNEYGKQEITLLIKSNYCEEDEEIVPIFNN